MKQTRSEHVHVHVLLNSTGQCSDPIEARDDGGPSLRFCSKHQRQFTYRYDTHRLLHRQWWKERRISGVGSLSFTGDLENVPERSSLTRLHT